MPDLRLMLAGGGNATDSRPLDEPFADWTLSGEGGGRMLFLPVAMDERETDYEECLRWVESVFEPLGVPDIEMWTDFHTPGRRPRASDLEEPNLFPSPEV